MNTSNETLRREPNANTHDNTNAEAARIRYTLKTERYIETITTETEPNVKSTAESTHEAETEAYAKTEAEAATSADAKSRSNSNANSSES